VFCPACVSGPVGQHPAMTCLMGQDGGVVGAPSSERTSIAGGWGCYGGGARQRAGLAAPDKVYCLAQVVQCCAAARMCSLAAAVANGVPAQSSQ
jgi:hypothetical protein